MLYRINRKSKVYIILAKDYFQLLSPYSIDDVEREREREGMISINTV